MQTRMTDYGQLIPSNRAQDTARDRITRSAELIFSGQRRMEGTRKKKGAPGRNHELEPGQQTLDTNPTTAAIRRYVEHHDFFMPRSFFEEFVWPEEHVLKPAQVQILNKLDECLYDLSSASYTDGQLVVMETGSGKSIAIDYFAVHILGSFVPVDMGTPARYTLIVACPTISLATEHFVRIQRSFSNYFSNVYRHDDLLARLTNRLPEVHTYTVDGEHKRPMFLVKLIAGSTGTETILCEPAQHAGSGETVTAGRKLAAVVICTFEHAASILAKANECVGPPFSSSIRSHIGGVVIDEVHHVLTGRPAAWAIAVLCRYWNIFTLSLTATASSGLETSLGSHLLAPRTQRTHPKVVYPIPLYTDDGALIRDAVEYAFLGWLQALKSDRRRRTAIFIENKIILKIVICLLAEKILVETRAYFPQMTRLAPINQQIYRQLDEYLRRDPVIMCDRFAYGSLFDTNSSITYYDAITIMAEVGVLQVTADLSMGVRKRLSAIMCHVTLEWSLVMATSAIAEGNNMLGLRTVVILLRKPGDNTVFQVHKLIQEIGRVDREDEGGLALCPTPPESSVVESTSMIPVVNYGELIGRGISGDMFDAIIHMENMHAPASFAVTPTFTTSVLLKFSDDTRLLMELERMSGTLSGVESVPYCYAGLPRAIPAFYQDNSLDETDRVRVVPCLMAKIVKHFHRDKELNLSPFLVEDCTVTAMTWLPVIAQLGLVVLYMTIPQYISRSAFQTRRDRYYEEFYAERLRMMSGIPYFRDIHKRISNVSYVFASVKLPADIRTTITQFRIRRPILAFKNEYDAFALFLTEILMVEQHWDLVCAEWGIHRNFYASFMQNLDIMVDICATGAYFPILEAQKRLFQDIATAGLLPGAEEVIATLSDTKTAKYSFGGEKTGVVCGCEMENPPFRFSPFIIPRFEVKDVVLENRVLILLAVAAADVANFFHVTDEFSFAKRRQLNSTTETRVFVDNHTTVVVNTDENKETPPTMRMMTFDQYHRVLSTERTWLDGHVKTLYEGQRMMSSSFAQE